LSSFNEVVAEAAERYLGINGDPSSDAFGRHRVSTPEYVFDAQLTYDLQPLLFEQITAQSGATIAHNTTDRNALFTFASTPTGGSAIMQTFEHFRYQPGRSQLVFVTFNFIEGVANCLKFAGYSDGSNGVELQYNGTTVRLAILSGTGHGNQYVNQADWDDPLDGEGRSAVTVDWTKQQILGIDLQALYVGRVRAYLDIDGCLVQFHEDNNANREASPYIQTANLPVRVGMTCTGTVSTTMRFNCCTVISEGGQLTPVGYQFSAEGTATAGNNTRTHILSVRPKTTFNSIANRSKFVLENIDVLVTGSTPIKWELVVGQAISGTTTFTDVNATYSGVEFNTAGTISGDPAIVIDSGYVPATNQAQGADHLSFNLRYPITLNAAGAVRPLGTLSLIVTGLGATSACRAAMNWREIR
jgi:hypothetical protein